MQPGRSLMCKQVVASGLAIERSDTMIRRMYGLKIAAMQRLRFIMAILAVAGSMWAVVDLHQHQDGLHKTGTCNICSLEHAVSHGSLTAMMQSLASPAIVSERKLKPTQRASSSATYLVALIRAPPFA